MAYLIIPQSTVEWKSMSVDIKRFAQAYIRKLRGGSTDTAGCIPLVGRTLQEAILPLPSRLDPSSFKTGIPYSANPGGRAPWESNSVDKW